MKDGRRNAPEVRFDGFLDDWEQRKLGELAEIVRGASPRPIQDPKWFDENSEVGWLRISDVTEQDGRIRHLEQKISELGQEKTRVLTEPYLLLSIAATVGKPVVNYVKTGVHDGFLIFAAPKFDREFMFQWLEMFRPMWQHYGQPGSQVNLNSDLVKNQEIMLPTIEEQVQIGLFFQQLDNTITLHQRKLDLLKQLKQGFLQQMFPQKNEKVPRVRLANFEDNWTYHKLNYYLQTSKSKNSAGKYDKNDVLSVSGNEGIVNQIKFQGRSFAGKSVILYKIVEKGDIVYTKSPLKINPYGIIKANSGQAGIVSTLYAVYKIKNQADSNFIECYFENNLRLNSYLKPLVNKGAKNDMKVSDDNALFGIVIFPNTLVEQQQISLFFDRLNNIIFLYQAHLDNLKEYKKAFLQKMFI